MFYLIKLTFNIIAGLNTADIAQIMTKSHVLLWSHKDYFVCKANLECSNHSSFVICQQYDISPGYYHGFNRVAGSEYISKGPLRYENSISQVRERSYVLNCGVYLTNNGELLGTLKSMSITVDLQTRRPRPIYRHLKESASKDFHKSSDFEMTWKPEDFACASSEIKSTKYFKMTITENHIDENGHVNYKIYLNYAAFCVEQTLDPSIQRSASFKHMNVYYKGEAFVDDQLDFRVDNHPNRDYVYVSVFKGSNTIVKIKFYDMLELQNLTQSRNAKL